jgi:F-type H+-transporting ATPase subunit delta
MKNALIADRYAKALSAAIADTDQLDPNLEALETLSAMFAESESLHGVLNNPSLRVPERIAVLEALLKRISAPAPACNVAALMLRRNRISLLPNVAELFRRRVDQRCSRVAATVTTALPLTDEQAEPLKLGLQEFAGCDVRLDRRVDETIVGGVVAEIAGVIIDGSVRARLERISRALIENDDGIMN